MNKFVRYTAAAITALGISMSAVVKDLQAQDDYIVSKNAIVQKNPDFLQDGKIRFGIVSDIEGAIDKAKQSADKLKDQDLDAILIAGDCYENERIRRNPLYPGSTDNLKEMVDGIRPYAELGIPVFIIPGNHEEKDIYKDAIAELTRINPQVFDITDRSVDLKGVNIVGMGGYHHPRFTAPDGFMLSKPRYLQAFEALKRIQSQDELTVFLTHDPPKSNKRIDYVNGPGNVGDDVSAQILNSGVKDVINLHGHIHEGGRYTATYCDNLSLNVSAVTDYMSSHDANTCVMTISGKEFDYQFR